MKGQLDLFSWADARPSNIIDAVPALIRKAAREVAYTIPSQAGGSVIDFPPAPVGAQIRRIA